MILNLGENLTPDEVNWKLDTVKEYIEKNSTNYNFKIETDPQLMKFTRGISKNQNFELQNTIVDHINNMKLNSVVKLYNRFLNPSTGEIENLTVSTELKKAEGMDTGGDNE